MIVSFYVSVRLSQFYVLQNVYLLLFVSFIPGCCALHRLGVLEWSATLIWKKLWKLLFYKYEWCCCCEDNRSSAPVHWKKRTSLVDLKVDDVQGEHRHHFGPPAQPDRQAAAAAPVPKSHKLRANNADTYTYYISTVLGEPG